MFFFFTCGTHTFTSALKGAEHITLQCQNCGNQTGKVMKRWEWFTFCFIPVIPFSFKPYKEVGCHVCHFWQDIAYRREPELQQFGGGTKVQGGAMPMNAYGGHGGPPGGGPPGYGPPPQGVPQYK
ncbi:uncharacterized protein J4E88_008530 [Alternaria novae-zelandiae]|uniref:uncharacterized protein n=1 Tax=Alternaria novae-zelandiae TaxID=430562 RepID=UPI0020C462C1|nr:uncharacterized protein J4E88_008530 [Alternaria novae-zelandiae]KAI4674063.1 hypothetical protein J4E88_008530 [Alternaria novae-zelandiae]